MQLYFYTMFLTSFKIEGNVVWENGGIWNGATTSEGISGKAQESMETKVNFTFLHVEKKCFSHIYVKRKFDLTCRKECLLSLLWMIQSFFFRNSVAPGDEDGGEPKTWQDIKKTFKMFSGYLRWLCPNQSFF